MEREENGTGGLACLFVTRTKGILFASSVCSIAFLALWRDCSAWEMLSSSIISVFGTHLSRWTFFPNRDVEVWSSWVEVLLRLDCCALVTSPSGSCKCLECLLVEDRLIVIKDIMNRFYWVTLFWSIIMASMVEINKTGLVTSKSWDGRYQKCQQNRPPINESWSEAQLLSNEKVDRP